MNKKRVLALLFIFIKYSDDTNHLSITDILNILAKEYDIFDANRKTIYNDIKTLNNFENIDIKLEKNGYYLVSFLNIAELKLLNDALSNIKHINKKDKDKFQDKLNQLCSIYNRKIINELSYVTNDKQNSNFIQNLNIILSAIKKQRILNISIKKNKSSIKPYFLYRDNGFYYLFYSYTSSDNLYKVRFDRIKDLTMSDETFISSISKDKILESIAESTNIFHSKDVKRVKIQILDDNLDVYSRLQDDFLNIIINQTKKEAYLKVSINNALFSKLASYQNKIKVLEPIEVSTMYQDYLQSIINVYLPENLLVS